MNKIKYIILATIFPLILIVIGLTYLIPKHTVVYNNVGNRVATDTSLYPNLALTPGETNPNVTQANISQNICNPQWSTKSIRPPSSYTTALKIQQIKQYGYTDTSPKDYEEDHLISLELGGNPTDPRNLWPEPYTTTPNAKDKDKVENLLHKEVCQGQITLLEAQKQITTDWVKIYNQMSKNLGSVGVGVSDTDD